MVDTTGDLIDGMHAMRVRQALLVACLRKLDGEILVTRREIFESAAFDVKIVDDGDVRVFLTHARK